MPLFVGQSLGHSAEEEIGIVVMRAVPHIQQDLPFFSICGSLIFHAQWSYWHIKLLTWIILGRLLVLIMKYKSGMGRSQLLYKF